MGAAAGAANEAASPSTIIATRIAARDLQDGDLIEAGVATDDGAIDLGTQRTTVRWT